MSETNGNGRNAEDIRDLAAAFHEFRADISKEIGALTTSHKAMTDSLQEFKGNVQRDLQDHETKLEEHGKLLSQQKGGIKVLGSFGAIAAFADILYHWFKK